MKEAGRSGDDAAWQGFRSRLEIGQLVDGVVVAHRPFGVFVDIGHPHFLALAELASLDEAPGSQPRRKEVIRPAVGTRIRAVLIAFGNPDGRQPRLRVRQTALRAAEKLQTVADLPLEQRRVFLQQALDSPDPEVRVAAIWRARCLPEHERATVLHAALRHSDQAVQAAAVGRVADLPQGERRAFLQTALEHASERIAGLAVWEFAHLLPQERVTFLRKAQQHEDRRVAWRARFELERLSDNQASDE